MGLLPQDFYNGTISNKNSNSATVPLLKDYLIDLDTGFLVKSESGQFTIVTGLQAVIMQVWRKLHTQQGKYGIFSNKYGNTFNDLIGKGKSYGNAYAYSKLQSALVDGVYIKSVDNVNLTLDKDKYTISFTLGTLYGNTSQNLDIPLED